MTEYNENNLNEDHDNYMYWQYEKQIKDGNLQIGKWYSGDSEVTNLRFVEKFDISTLTLFVSNDMSVKLRSYTLKELTILNSMEQDEDGQQRWNIQIDDLQLENLEVLDLTNINLENSSLYNLSKFNTLRSLNVSKNNVDLTNIHSVTSLTKLSMVQCGLKNIDQISSLVNLEDLELSSNGDMDLSPLQQVRSLKKLSMQECGLTNIDQITQLTNLEVLKLASNQLLTINSVGSLVNLKELNISKNNNLDITPLKDLVGLIKLNLSYCALTQLSALKSLINLQLLDLSDNSGIIITELQYLKNITHLNLFCCNLVSIYVLRPLVNLEELDISFNKILYLDAAFNQMTKLEKLIAEKNRISDFSQLEQRSNFNSLDEYGDRNFDISGQKTNSQEELYFANHLRKIERPNIQLKEIQNQHQFLKTALKYCKQQINAVLNCANHTQFTSSAAQLFELLNQPVSQ
ncbi:leucine-rich_repeat domain-containing protein [Hexamita inflata]|uniref:Leucine-rich repeat domain-containing protein n=1 Tax=Hexamita inflata TaxID=28002 RepID=A0AA86PJD0_9EUKA|nr:leucine-rich repeat domain-containing protein [Hexamita inflata]